MSYQPPSLTRADLLKIWEFREFTQPGPRGLGVPRGEYEYDFRAAPLSHKTQGRECILPIVEGGCV